MPSFATDVSVLVPGLGGTSPECSLLVLCAYGRLRYFETRGREEIVESPEARGGGTLLGLSIDELQRRAAERAAALAENLRLAREDFLLILSTPILDALERTLQRGGVGRGLGTSAEHSRRARRAAASLVAAAPSISLSDVPRHTESREFNLLLETAAQTRAGFVVSASPLAVGYHGQDFRYEGGETRICSLAQFLVYSEIESEIDNVDCELLDLALALQ